MNDNVGSIIDIYRNLLTELQSIQNEISNNANNIDKLIEEYKVNNLLRIVGEKRIFEELPLEYKKEIETYLSDYAIMQVRIEKSKRR